MPITSVNRVKSIAVPLRQSDGSDIVSIYQNNAEAIGSELLPGYTVVSFNCFIKNLKAFGSMNSLEEAPLPDFDLEDSDTDKLHKTLDIEWKSPRKQLNLYIGSVLEWLQIGSISLLNPYGYPFRVYNLMDLFTDNLALELGNSFKIGVAFQDVGYGLLESDDKLIIHGSCMEEIFVESAATSDNVIVNIPPGVINVNISGVAATQNLPDGSIGNTSVVGNSFEVGN